MWLEKVGVRCNFQTVRNYQPITRYQLLQGSSKHLNTDDVSTRCSEDQVLVEIYIPYHNPWVNIQHCTICVALLKGLWASGAAEVEDVDSYGFQTQDVYKKKTCKNKRPINLAVRSSK